MYANIAVNSSGWSVTSNHCSGLRRIFFSARHAIARLWSMVSRSDGRVTTVRSSTSVVSRSGSRVVLIG